MGVMKRMSMIFRSKANRVLDKAEDPRETLDYSYQQLELLQRSAAASPTSPPRASASSCNCSSCRRRPTSSRTRVARRSRSAARTSPEALTRRSGVQQQMQDLQTQYVSLQGEEETTLASQRLQAKVDAFRTRKETIKATYTAAEAQTRIGEAFSGISEEMSDVGLAMQRAEERTQTLQACGRDR